MGRSYCGQGRGGRQNPQDAFAIPVEVSLEEMERVLIVKTLDETGGNRTRAAEIRGINRDTLQNKLKQYGLAVPPAEPA